MSSTRRGRDQQLHRPVSGTTANGGPWDAYPRTVRVLHRGRVDGTAEVDLEYVARVV